MFTAKALLTKWGLYTAATAVFLLLQNLVLDSLQLMGVVPFLAPLIVAVVAAWEGSTQGTIFGIAFGFVCDLLGGSVFPGAYTLSFFCIALCVSLLAASVVMPNIFGSFLYALIAFLLLDLIQGLYLLLFCHAAPLPILSLAGRELLVSILFVIPVFLLFRYLHHLFRYD